MTVHQAFTAPPAIHHSDLHPRYIHVKRLIHSLINRLTPEQTQEIQRTEHENMPLHRVHTAGVAGSIPAAPTNEIKYLADIPSKKTWLHPRLHPRIARISLFASAEVAHG